MKYLKFNLTPLQGESLLQLIVIDNIKIWKASHNKTRDYCEKWCNSCKECKSFSICNDSECLLRDYLVERSDLTKDSYVCTTYYRIQNGDNLQQSNGRNIENKGIYNRDIGGLISIFNTSVQFYIH